MNDDNAVYIDRETLKEISALINEASSLYQSNNFSGAIEKLLIVTNNLPAFYQARELLIQCLLLVGRDADALEQCDLNARIFHAHGLAAQDITDQDQMYRVGLNLKGLYAAGPQTAISGRIIDRAMDYFRRAAKGRLDLIYLGGVTLKELGFQDYAAELFDMGEVLRKQMRIDSGTDEIKLRFIFGDTSISAGIPGVPNLLNGIGHIAYLDSYLKLLKLGWGEDIQPFMVLKDSPVVNRYFLDCFRPHMRFVDDPAEIETLRPHFLTHEEMVNNQFRVNGRPMLSYNAFAAIQAEWERRNLPPLLSLPQADIDEGWRRLEPLGLRPGAWFVCLHVRDNGYRKEVELASENRGLENHNNAAISHFRKSAESIIERGGWVLRMGGPEMCEMPFSHERIIDYAHSSICSEFMDIFLVSQCRFFLGTASGLACVPHCFGVRKVHTNLIPAFVRGISSRDIFLPKLTRRKSDGRYLSFLEAWAKPYGQTMRPEVLDSFGLVAEDNLPEDILAATLEMLEILDGTAPQEDAEILDLRRKYDRLAELVDLRDGGNGPGTRIGREFLRRNGHLLDDVP